MSHNMKDKVLNPQAQVKADGILETYGRMGTECSKVLVERKGVPVIGDFPIIEVDKPQKMWYDEDDDWDDDEDDDTPLPFIIEEDDDDDDEWGSIDEYEQMGYPVIRSHGDDGFRGTSGSPDEGYLMSKGSIYGVTHSDDEMWS